MIMELCPFLSVFTEAASPLVPVPSNRPPVLTSFTVDARVAHRALADVFSEDVPSMCVDSHQAFGVIVARVWEARSWKQGGRSDGEVV